MRSGALARLTALTADEFTAQHWSRTPLLTRGDDLAAGFADLLSPQEVDELVAERALREPMFRMVQDAEPVRGTTRTVAAGGRRLADVADPDAVARAHLAGATLVLNALHRTHPPVVRFCAALAEELGHAVQCNAYVTPGGGAQGFAFHHDTHDVFVLQVSGRKAWRVHRPLVELPLPSQPRAGAELATGEPVLDVALEAGDVLYLPRGWVHAAATADDHSVHLTVGVLTTTWHDVLQEVVQLAQDERWFREALPVGPERALDDLPAFLRSVADWVAALPPEEVRQRLEQRLARNVPVEPLRLLAQAEAVRTLTPQTVVRTRRGLAFSFDGTVLRLADREVSLPSSTRDCMHVLLDGPVSAASLGAAGLGLDVDDAVVLVRRMLREGVVVPA